MDFKEGCEYLTNQALSYIIAVDRKNAKQEQIYQIAYNGLSNRVDSDIITFMVAMIRTRN